jgi:hypothetical protein
MKSKKGSNSLPQILYPLQITYIAADGTSCVMVCVGACLGPTCALVSDVALSQ